MTPKQTHDLEQAFASLAALAAFTARYYAALLQEGVPADVASMLTWQMQTQMLKGQQGAGGI